MLPFPSALHNAVPRVAEEAATKRSSALLAEIFASIEAAQHALDASRGVAAAQRRVSPDSAGCQPQSASAALDGTDRTMISPYGARAGDATCSRPAGGRKALIPPQVTSLAPARGYHPTPCPRLSTFRAPGAQQ